MIYHNIICFKFFNHQSVICALIKIANWRLWSTEVDCKHDGIPIENYDFPVCHDKLSKGSTKHDFDSKWLGGHDMQIDDA